MRVWLRQTLAATRPPNDVCDDAAPLTAPVTVGTIVRATTEAFTMGASYADVWYTFTATATGNVYLKTELNPGSALEDTVLILFTGDCGNLVSVAFNGE